MKKILYFNILLLSWVLLFPQTTIPAGNVSGIWDLAGFPYMIEGAEIYVGSYGPSVTNASGKYLIEEAVTGIQPVTATKEGFYNFSGKVTVLENQSTVYDIALDPNRFGCLFGTVTDSDSGNPLEGAEINAISAGGYEYDALTNANGEYEITNIVAETYDVYCEYPNYIPEVQEGIIVENDLTTTVDFAMEGYSYWNDFENNDGGFISNNPAGWQWGIPSNGPSNAYSGDKLWGTVLANNYPNGANFTVDSPEYYLIASFNPILFFWHWYEIESSYDGGNVKVSSDGGISWSVIEPINGYTGTANSANPLSGEPIFCGYQGFWEYVEFDLSSYTGQNLIFRWHFGSDSSVQYPGWFIDDVGITGFSFGCLFGTVTEFGTGNPIEGATVSIVGTGLSGITQADGFYEILGTWPGVFDISCTAPLYLDAEESNIYIANVITTLDFSLLWSEISVYPEGITITLPPDTTDTVSITITNNGPGDLEYNIDLEFPAEIGVVNRTRNHPVSNTRKNLNSSKVAKILKKMSIVRSESKINDRDPNVSSQTQGSTPTDEIWDIQGTFRPIDASGVVSQAGMEFDGTYFYCPVQNSSDICKYDSNGNFIETFQIPGVSETCDLCYDGQYMYGGSSGSQIYCWDPVTYNLVNTINSASGLYRAIAYDSEYNGFLGNNWTGDIVCTAHDGSTIYVIPDVGITSIYGMAYDNYSEGGPYLWLFSQAGSGAEIHQVEIASAALTGVSHDVLTDFPSAGIAGGLWASPDFVPGTFTLGGLVQGEDAFMYELCETQNWVMIINNASGIVPGNGGSIAVDINFSSMGLNVGDVLTGNLMIHNNSNYGGDFILPITLVVEYVNAEHVVLPLLTDLIGNYPNPFNPETNITYSVKETGKVTLEIYNLRGQLVKTLVDDVNEAGDHIVAWNGTNEVGKSVSSGVYFYKMYSGKYTSTKKMILMK